MSLDLALQGLNSSSQSHRYVTMFISQSYQIAFHTHMDCEHDSNFFPLLKNMKGIQKHGTTPIFLIFDFIGFVNNLMTILGN